MGAPRQDIQDNNNSHNNVPVDDVHASDNSRNVALDEDKHESSRYELTSPKPVIINN